MSHTLTWVPAVQGHEVALDGTTVVCRQPPGPAREALPSAVRDSPNGKRLTALSDLLRQHQAQCRATVQSWLLAEVPIPAGLLAQVWPDPSWRQCLENLVVTVDGRTGLLTNIGDQGQTTLLSVDAIPLHPAADPVSLPHPVLLPDVERWRAVLDAWGITQGIQQVARQVHRRPGDVDGSALSTDPYPGPPLGSPVTATDLARDHGYRVHGACATVRTSEGEMQIEARYRLGPDDPAITAKTGRLAWFDESRRPLPLRRVGPVAWSEGVRMAELIHTGGVDDGQ